MKFVVPTEAASARQDLTAAGRVLGFVPNLLAVLAEAAGAYACFKLLSTAVDTVWQRTARWPRWLGCQSPAQ
jgi:hypothetical protein